MQNVSPEVWEIREQYDIEWKDGEVCVTQQSIFQIVRSIKDPEHDYTLEQLKVVDIDRINIKKINRRANSAEVVEIEIVPTIPHCSMVGFIGLSILYKLSKILSSKYIVRVIVCKGTHTQDDEMTKQFADTERTSSAFLNASILSTLLSLL